MRKNPSYTLYSSHFGGQRGVNPLALILSPRFGRPPLINFTDGEQNDLVPGDLGVRPGRSGFLPGPVATQNQPFECEAAKILSLGSGSKAGKEAGADPGVPVGRAAGIAEAVGA